MTYRALATDYDGTIAHDGVVHPPTLAALARAREAGLKLIMVTGRELADLFNTFSHPEIFHRIVAENGAVLYDPASQAVEVLASAPPPDLIAALQAQKIPLSVGHSIVATVEPHDRPLLEAIESRGLQWHVIFNKGSVMALPADVTKATGLAAALTSLGIPHGETVGVGDAENDRAFLEVCGLSAAVQNALPVIKETTAIVTAGARGNGVIELIDRLLAEELPQPEAAP